MEKARAELELSLVLSEIGDLAPVISVKNKVRKFVNSADSDVLSVNLDHPRGGLGAVEAVGANRVADRMMETAHSSGTVPLAVTGRREDGDTLYIASAKRSSSRPVAVAMGSVASQVGLLNGKG